MNDLDRSHVGWLRTDGRLWRPVITGTSEALCNLRLQAVAELHQHADVTVLPAGVNPNAGKVVRR